MIDRSLTLRQQSYELIRQKLLSGALKPGSRLSDDLLSKEFGISRSPIREAISQLASEGLVEQRPRLGAYVKQPDRHELEELYEIREAVERFAARKAARCISPAGRTELTRLCGEMEAVAAECRALPDQVATDELRQRFLANDLAFHTAVLHAAGNDRMTRLVTSFKVLTRVFSFVPVVHDVAVIDRSCRHHLAVAAAIRKRDAAGAGRWMVRHIRYAKARVLAGYDRWAADQARARSAGRA